MVIAKTRKYLITAFLRAQGLCLINRLCFFGEVARAAAGRRDLVRKRDLMAHYQAQRPGPVSSWSDLCALSKCLEDTSDIMTQKFI